MADVERSFVLRDASHSTYADKDVEVAGSWTHDAGSANKHAAPKQDFLQRSLGARQLQMIAIGGTIGTGLFLGTGKSLATGGPGALLVCYSLIGFVVYNTMLCLGEMSAFIPIAGSFTSYASRFVDDGFGFALTWNYWFNDAVSVAGDLTAAQIILEYWTDFPGWYISLGLLVVIVAINCFGVQSYGEAEYALSLLKVVTIIIFLITGIVVNVGGNTEREYIGFSNWGIGSAPFVGGVGGLATVFVTASFAFGGTESIGITAGETRNPRRNMPKAIKNVFWRVLIFYILGTFLIGLNIPYNAPGLSDGTVSSSPFTLVFEMTGISAAAHIMNAVVLTSVISAGNHALFAGTRLLYALGHSRQAPRVFGKLTGERVPLISMGATTVVACICFASSFVGSGQLWEWIQSLVGVSNQIAWVSIGVTSWRFNNALKAQGIPESELPFRNPFHKWGPLFVVFANSFFIIVQGWKSVVPSQNEDNRFDFMSFLSYYLEIPVLLFMWLVWKLIHKTKIVPLELMDLSTDRYVNTPEDDAEDQRDAEKTGCVDRTKKILVNVF